MLFVTFGFAGQKSVVCDLGLAGQKIFCDLWPCRTKKCCLIVTFGLAGQKSAVWPCRTKNIVCADLGLAGPIVCNHMKTYKSMVHLPQTLQMSLQLYLEIAYEIWALDKSIVLNDVYCMITIDRLEASAIFY